MKTYLAEFKEDGLTFCVRFEALSLRKADNIARKRGWKVVGEFVDEVSCPDDVIAMIEKNVMKPTVH